MNFRIVATLGILTLLVSVAVPAAAQNRGDCGGKVAESWSITIAAPDEAGERMVVEGRVLAADGKTPVPGVTVFVFHTDAEGYYSPGGMDESNARLCGLMLTDEAGRYRFETIKPAHYATRGAPPAHIHYRVWGSAPGRQSFTLHFAGDPLLGERGEHASDNPTWATIRPLSEAEDGVLHIVRDLKLR